MALLSLCHLLTLCCLPGCSTSPSSCSEHDPTGLLTASIMIGKAALCRASNLPDTILMGLCFSMCHHLWVCELIIIT